MFGTCRLLSWQNKLDSETGPDARREFEKLYAEEPGYEDVVERLRL